MTKPTTERPAFIEIDGRRYPRCARCGEKRARAQMIYAPYAYLCDDGCTINVGGHASGSGVT